MTNLEKIQKMKARELYPVKSMVQMLENVRYNLLARSHKAVIDAAIDFIMEQEEEINRQQALLSGISQLITDNTYPTFDKDGKPVSVWNPDGYKQIDDLLKGGTYNGQKM